MSYASTNPDYGGGYPQYSESDILDFITHGQSSLDEETDFPSLEGAEDMMFGNFGNFSQNDFPGGLGDSGDQLSMAKYGRTEDVPLPQPTSSHASFVAQKTVGVSSFAEHNARARLEQHQRMIQQQQQHAITPLSDTPHTPTNLEHQQLKPIVLRTGFKTTSSPSPGSGLLNQTQGNTRVATAGIGGRSDMNKVGSSPSFGVRAGMTPVMNHNALGVRPNALHMALQTEEEGLEKESIELREFVAPGSQETDALLNELQVSIEALQKQIDDMRVNQTAALQNLCENLVLETSDSQPLIANLQEMLDVQTEWLHNTESMHASVFEQQKAVVLTPAEADRATVMSDELAYIIANISLMIQEIIVYMSWVREGGEVPALEKLVSLVISKAPFPSIWMKRNQMSEAEAIYVKLLHGCSVTLTSVSEVKATMHCHTPYNAKTTPAKPIIDFDNFPMDPSTLMASCQFVFTAGSRKDVAQVRFSMNVEGSSFATSVLLNRGNDVSPQELISITSSDSKPFIVITNECQYGETFGILFQKDVFHHQWGEAQSSIPWPLFANAIQRYFIRASRQDPASPKRGLSYYDLEHIHATFFASSPSIELKSSQKFWDWYGKVLHRLRYQRHVAALWMEGLIFGMVSREGVCEQLISRPPGTFLLRFSESSAGFIAVGYRVSGANAGIKNYLVKQEDTASATVKTLPDFLRSRPEFSVLLQYTGQHLEDGFPLLYPIHKDYALKAYCAARPHKPVDPKAGSPYDEL